MDGGTPSCGNVSPPIDAGRRSLRAESRYRRIRPPVHDGRIVAVRDGPVVGTAFHPELAGVSAIHDLAFFE
jgi:hypothetical protein